MQKFLAGVLCAVMAFSAAAISASADDELLTPENASNISQKEKIISSLLKNENEWLDYSKVLKLALMLCENEGFSPGLPLVMTSGLESSLMSSRLVMLG